MTGVPLDAPNLPCGQRCLPGCPIKDKLDKLQKGLISLAGDPAAPVVREFLNGYAELITRSTEARQNYPSTIALPALFDLVLSAKYAAHALTNSGWTYCAGSDYGSPPAKYFPFLNACPRCTVQRDYRPPAKSNKPGSAAIGRMAADTTVLVLAEYLARTAPQLRVAKCTQESGDVDAVIYRDDLLALAEIKSSPLVLYPLEILLPDRLTELRDGEAAPMTDHARVTDDLTENLSFYLPHWDARIPLGPRDGDWPHTALARFVADPDNVEILLAAWRDLYEIYAGSRQVRGRTERRRWLMCGCGSPVDDGKNAPGLDRTDDIKKGTYQVLKFGTTYKELCAKRVIRAVLVSNVFPLRLYNLYLADVQDVIWSKEVYQLPAEPGIMSFRAEHMFNLYDALLCLTDSRYRDEQLRAALRLANPWEAGAGE